jgi:ribonuclease P protein component
VKKAKSNNAPMPKLDDFAFPRHARLLSSEAFQAVFATGRRYSGGNLTLVVIPNAEKSARLGLAVAKKNLPRAHDRNRIKRLARDCFRTHRPQLPQVDVVLLTRASAKTQANSIITAELTALLERICKGVVPTIAATATKVDPTA